MPTSIARDNMFPPPPNGLPLALFVLHIIAPALVLLGLLFIVPLRRPLQPSSSSEITQVIVSTTTPRRALILTLLFLSSLTYLAQGLTSVVFTVISRKWSLWSGLDLGGIIGIIALSGLAALGAWKDIHGVEIWGRKRVKTAIAASLSCDVALLVLMAISLKHSLDALEPRHRIPLGPLLCLAFTAARILLLFPLIVALYHPRTVYTSVSQPPSPTGAAPEAQNFQESSLLLAPSAALSSNLSPSHVEQAASQRKYGTFPGNWSIHPSNPTTRAATPITGSPSKQAAPPVTPEISLDPSWREMCCRIRRVMPYLWPSKSKPLQLVALICIALLILGRIVNVLLPLSLGQLVKVLEEKDNVGRGWRNKPWVYLGAYVILRFLQSSGGLGALRDSLWAPVMQYSDREMSQLSFDHILNLSYAWHTRRKTGEVLRILDRGASINHTFELILFNIIPTFLDILIALVVFVFKFEWTLALVIFVVMFAYVAASVMLTRWRTKLRRQMNERDVVTRGIHTDCLLNYETVKYFCGEVHEGERYAEAIREYQTSEYKVLTSLNLLNLVQTFIITLGLLVGSLIVALRVVHGKSKPSDFVIFITYLAQLYGPLNSLGYVYRSINQSLVDTEKLLKLLGEPTEVNDKPNAPDLVVNHGEIEFQNVSFSYDNRTTALSSVSFKVPKGSSVALVGESGSGKSTVLRLLYRFYDLNEGEGRILIDGQDIRDVTQASLRKAIGVVPQDSVLFNTSIGYNIGYGKFGASPEDIEAAAKAAQMHDRIMSFPDGYETKVGERGVRLSGGEKQRVAIARTLLKNPPVLLLDEATSALDTSTEKDIQKALQNLVKGRSSLSIAHRLSTIASADIILVLKDGQIVEQGSHKELLALNGVFASMWADQISASDGTPVPVDSGGVKKEISGYSVGSTQLVDDAADPEQLVIDTIAASDPAPGPSSVDVDHPVEATDIDIPTSSSPSAPVEFPTADDSTTQRDAHAPAVSFPVDLNQPPSRSGTPDPEGDTKRKMTTPQTFQRLARKISLGTRRQGSGASSFMAGFGRKESLRNETGSLRGEGSARESLDSVGGSEVVEGDKAKSKKEKKEKKGRSKKTMSVG